MVAHVVLNTPVRQQFSYAVPPGMDIRIGMRALVPFGHREMTAYVVGLEDSMSPEGYTLKNIKRLIDKEPLFGLAEVALSQWMSRFYLCSQWYQSGVVG